MLQIFSRYANRAVRLGLVIGCCVVGATHCLGPLSTDRAVASESISQAQSGSPDVLVESTALERPTSGAEPRFTLLAPAETGVDFAHRVDTRHPLKRLYGSGYVTGGVAIGDVDGNGLPDLFFTSGSGRNRLFTQTAKLRFVDATDAAGLRDDDLWSSSGTMADVDNDGDLDIYICNYDDRNQLLLNDGSGKFTEGATAAGLAIDDASLMSAFCDFDRDGDLDVYVVANRLYRAGGRPRKPPVAFRNGRPFVTPAFSKYYQLIRVRSGRYQIDDVGRADFLMRNEGDGTFTDVSTEAGLWGEGFGLSVTWWDYNHDGWPDIYVANDFNDPDRLYRNNGDGTFTDLLAREVPRTCWFSMGVDFGDLNGDGVFDLLVADMASSTYRARMTTSDALDRKKLNKVLGPPPQFMKNTLLLGTKTGRFLEVAELAGLAATDWTWAVKLGDYNLDGRLDVFVTNGISRSYNDADMPISPDTYIGRTEWDLFESSPPRPEKNLAFRNEGDLQFTDVSEAWGLGHVGMSYAAATGDLDRDGDLDLVVSNLDEPIHIYRNDSIEGGRLAIQLRGTSSNRFGFGATITAETPQGRQIRMLSPHTGFLSSNDPAIHFGLGEAEQVDRLTVHWPSGRVQELRDVPANQWLTIREPEDGEPSAFEASITEADPQAAEFAAQPLFANRSKLINVRHTEKPYDDFAREPLLPRKLSQLGPGLAAADFNGDGRDDLLIGGAAGYAGTVLLGGADGRLKPLAVEALEQDKACEDMGAVWLDANGDGAVDLYVASGGVECSPGDDVLRDRLYLGDGRGNFSKAPDGALPDVRQSGSAVCAADFDLDGDLDLFVGTRVVPGAYPLSGPSQLLENRDGRFVDAAERLAPALQEIGMVAGAVWSDVDDDGWIDLLVTTEWGPVRLLKNQQGRLVDATQDAGLADRTGWFQGIAARDADGDGDMDFVVTNFGLNTRYRASEDAPLKLYYGSFDATGGNQIVESEMKYGMQTPVRTKNALSRAMPSFNARYPTHRQFAEATFEELFPPQQLAQALKLQCNTLEIGLLVNDGDGRFTFQPLPRLAQASPAFGVVFSELDGRPGPDVYLAQNFFQNPAEIGPMDSGMGLLLTGEGDGQFAVAMPEQSGLVVPGDATAAVQLQAGGATALVVGQNNDEPATFVRSGDPAATGDRRLVRVRLRGPAGNQFGFGARVALESSDYRQTAEVAGGSGYLSQSSPTLTFAVPELDPGAGETYQFEVRWPDGAISTHPGSADADVTLTHPKLEATR